IMRKNFWRVKLSTAASARSENKSKRSIISISVPSIWIFLRRAPEFVPGAEERLDAKTRAAFREGWLPYEDTVPFLYLFDLLTGKATSSS
ncbi:hypothetical protein LI095_10185, partial [Veillonella atypica]|uniref:hypothetical protein n=1 Tax=Veillonella atypica TaxID=39777 RepID=UPI001D067DF3